MRKKETAALVLALTIGLASGCAPGDISRYVQKAQQTGERIFEGTAVAVSSDGGHEEAAEETAKMQQETEEGQSADSGEAAGAQQETMAEQSADGSKAAGVQQEAMAEQSAGSSGTAGAQQETVAEQSTEVGKAAAAQQETEQSAEIQLPAMMQEAPEKAQEFLQENAEQFSGSFAGSGNLSKSQKAAMLSAMGQNEYDDKTLCLINDVRFERQNGSFLFFADYTSLAARGKMSGDLWFFNGQDAARVAEDMQLLQLRTVQLGGETFLMVGTQQKEGERAQLYQVAEGVCSPCFEDARAIEVCRDGLCVAYASEEVRYDPFDKSWEGEMEEIPYYYEKSGNGFVQQKVRALTQKEYLDYIRPQEKDVKEQEWKDEQEKLFNTPSGENCDYRYTFFAIGEERIGYRRCITGCPADQKEETGHAVAEYAYVIALLENGKLTEECSSVRGEGYYFADWENREQERKELDVIPNEYRENRISKVAESGSTAEVSALKAVREVQEYPDDALCFIRTADYDGDGSRETFVAAGSYDGAFGAPVCDLWYVSEEIPLLLLENMPVRSVELCGQEKTFLLLVEGYEKEGISDYLYGVREKRALRHLETAAQIAIEENGGVIAWMKQEGGERPRYYRVLDGAPVEYELQERDAEELLEYENGRVVRKRLEALAGGLDNLLCLRRENGLWHLMFLEDGNAVSYETYQVQDNALVLIDCGKGGYLMEVADPEKELPKESIKAETEAEESAETAVEAEEESTETETEAEENANTETEAETAKENAKTAAAAEESEEESAETESTEGEEET